MPPLRRWALGILIYEMVAGFPPYGGDSAMATYKAILEGVLEFPRPFSADVRDIVRRLLHPSMTKRLGCLRNGAADVRTHPWYCNLQPRLLLRMKVKPPFVPTIKDSMDTSNFAHFEEEPDDPYEDDGSGWDRDF